MRENNERPVNQALCAFKGYVWRPREDSNHYLSFRRGLLYPVELRGHKNIVIISYEGPGRKSVKIFEKDAVMSSAIGVYYPERRGRRLRKKHGLHEL